MENKIRKKNTRTSNGMGYIYKDKSRNRWRGEIKIQIKLRIRPYKISRIKVSKLSLIDCEDWVREMGKDHSDYSVRRAVSELKVFMGYAKTLGIIRENFIGDVSNKPKHKSRGIVVFEVYELNQFLDYASELGKDDYVRRVEYLAINLLAKTGRRRGEVLALKWE